MLNGLQKQCVLKTARDIDVPSVKCSNEEWHRSVNTWLLSYI